MAAFGQERQPSLTQWMNASIQASIVLDKRENALFTNLDEISGKLIVRCSKDIAVNSIIVKLEGESRTRLLGTPSGEGRRDPNAQLEHHKLLYKVQTVFPPAEVAESRSHVGKGVFTLPAGTHEYPWKFKLPFNNACYTPPTTIPGIHMGISSRGFEVTKNATNHVKKTLPPTLAGFPGEAEISYFVKATVQRQGLLKENPRAYSAFQFLPIEPPRPPLTGEQIFARQRHAFAPNSKKAGKSSIFSSLKSGSTTSTGELPPGFSLDMRLPKPAILTCNKAIPLSIVYTKTNASTEAVYVQSLQISLIGITKVRAHEYEREEQTSWIMISKSNMGIRLGNESDPEGTETVLDDMAWRDLTLPNSVSPSFETCNISRHYQVEARFGFSYGGTFNAKPQQITLPLRLSTLIYSGIEPPKEALNRMVVLEPAPVTPVAVLDDHKTAGEVQQPSSSLQPNAATPAVSHAPPLPLRPGEGDMYADAPPSYEDAIASELPPVDGYRPAYAPPAAGEDSLLNRDEKRRWPR